MMNSLGYKNKMRLSKPEQAILLSNHLGLTKSRPSLTEFSGSGTLNANWKKKMLNFFSFPLMMI